MQKMFKTLSIFKLIPIFVLLGFFACVIHIVPQSGHGTTPNSEHDTNQVSCVDHQVTNSLSHRDNSDLIQIAILPETSIEPILISKGNLTYSSWSNLYPPPNKTTLYIKNNTFLI